MFWPHPVSSSNLKDFAKFLVAQYSTRLVEPKFHCNEIVHSYNRVIGLNRASLDFVWRKCIDGVVANLIIGSVMVKSRDFEKIALRVALPLCDIFLHV